MALRAAFARGKPAIHLDQNPAVPVTFIRELSAYLAERSVLDRAGVSAAGQTLHIQVFDANQTELAHQTRRERMQRALALLPHPRVRTRYAQPLLLVAPTALLPSCQAALLLTQVSQVRVIAFG